MTTDRKTHEGTAYTLTHRPKKGRTINETAWYWLSADGHELAATEDELAHLDGRTLTD